MKNAINVVYDFLCDVLNRHLQNLKELDRGTIYWLFGVWTFSVAVGHPWWMIPAVSEGTMVLVSILYVLIGRITGDSW